MGRPICSSIRAKVIEAWESEQLSYSELSRRFQLNYNTVRHLCLSYKQSGISALSADYSNCGKKISPSSEKVYRLVRLIKHHHSGWGVPYILTKIKVKFPHLKLQSVRNYQKRLKHDCPKSKMPIGVIPKMKEDEKVRLAHDEWQIDAKERIWLPTGIHTCYLNITDTKSHGILKAKPFSPRAYQSGGHSTHPSIIIRLVQTMGNS